MFDFTNMDRLKNKTVLITGASSGIGASCAKIFAKAGSKLLLCARRIDRLENLIKELRKEYNSSIYFFQLDVTKRQDVEEKLNSLPEEWKEIEVLVNNAGLSRGLDKLYEGKVEEWEEMIDTNVKGLLYVTRVVLPWMVKRNSGHIINIGSVAGHEVYPAGNVYCATKYAVNAINKGLKMDLLGTNIRVSSVDPGLVETEFSIVRFRGDKERAKVVYQGLTPLTPDDVADAVFYCASRPPHINISEIIMLSTDQSSATMVHRKKQ
jgi:serine 3-dehydrogenase